MHRSMTPWRNARFAVFGLGISLILFILAMTMPFYEFVYFFQGKTMTFIDAFKANKQILIPFVLIIIALVCQVAALVSMIFFSKKKVFQHVGSIGAFLGAFLSFMVLLIGVSRLLIIPYEFTYYSEQTLKGGYIVYILFLLFNGVLGCYMTAISGKLEEIA